MRSLFITLAFSLVATVAAASPKVVVAEDGAKYIIHKIAKGETVYSLAKLYEISVDELRAANEDLSDNVKVGQKIQIPIKKAVSEVAVQITTETVDHQPIVETNVPQAQVEVAIVEEPKDAASKVVTKAEKILEPQTDSMTTLVGQALSFLEQFVSKGSPAIEQLPVVEHRVPFRRLRRADRAKVVLMLPFGSETQAAYRYIDFYRGFMMGMDSVRLSGRSVDLHVFNTARDSVRVAEIVASGELQTADLIVGPVYDDELKPVLALLENRGIPVVSPLSSHSDIKSDVLFQMAPSSESRFRKVQEAIDGAKRVVIISTNKIDKKFDAAVRNMLAEKNIEVVEKKYYTEQEQTISTGATELATLLRDGPSVVIVTSNNEIEVNNIVNRLYLLKQSLAGRTANGEPFTIVGNGSWARFKNIDKTIFYKSRVKLITSYNASFDCRINKTFENRYIRLYGALPTLYSYRGYDAAIVFVRAIFDKKIEKHLEGVKFTPLATPYLFEKNEKSGVRANSEWILQSYNVDNTITIE